MIKNGKQAAITRAKLEAAISERSEYLKNKNDEVDEISHQFYMDSFTGLIDELQHQLDVYDHLKNGNFRCIPCDSLDDLPNLFIAARIAQNLSQSALADKLGIPEQQIQRYESMDYDTASLSRLREVSEALNLKVSFKDTFIIGNGPHFQLPEGIDPKSVEDAESLTRLEGSLIL